MNYDDLARQTKLLLHSLPERLAQVERGILGAQSLNQSSETSKSLQDARGSIHQISSNFERLNNLLFSAEPASQRSQMRLSLDQMRHECKHYQNSLQVAERKLMEREHQIREREELLTHEFTTNAALRNSSASTVIKFDSDLEHHSRLSTVSRRLDDLLASGSASLSALQEQGMTVKGAQRRVFAALNTLGLSNTVMRLIERRTHQDKVIFWLLVVVSIFLMWSVWTMLH